MNILWWCIFATICFALINPSSLCVTLPIWFVAWLLFVIYEAP